MSVYARYVWYVLCIVWYMCIYMFKCEYIILKTLRIFKANYS